MVYHSSVTSYVTSISRVTSTGGKEDDKEKKSQVSWKIWDNLFGSNQGIFLVHMENFTQIIKKTANLI